MKVFFQLYKRYSDIAAAEALEVCKGREIGQFGNEILVADAKTSEFQRLSLSHAAFELLFVCGRKQLGSKIAKFSWQKHYRKNFKVTCHHVDACIERAIAQEIGEKIKNSKAEMKKPISWFNFFFIDGKVIAGKLLWQNNEDFEARKVHKWPAPHPTGTHPQIARAMVNLTGIQKGELVDPFCGAGGVLIEAGLMGFIPIGFDIEPELLAKAVKNLQGYKISNFLLAKKDALTLNNAKYLVADLPYGRNTPPKGLEKLYAGFLSRLKQILKGKAVLGFPSNINYKQLIKKSKLKIRGEYDYYINERLTKKIVVISP
jgi:tRNA (guanine10-N2)-dimethyltransferase